MTHDFRLAVGAPAHSHSSMRLSAASPPLRICPVLIEARAPACCHSSFCSLMERAHTPSNAGGPAFIFLSVLFARLPERNILILHYSSALLACHRNPIHGFMSARCLSATVAMPALARPMFSPCARGFTSRTSCQWSACMMLSRET